MTKANGFITLHRQILEWEWFENSETLHLFIFLLLSANFVDGKFKGRLIKRGQVVTSLPKISTGTGLSIRQARTALEHLKSTGEVTDESSSQYRIITIVKYDQFQKATDELTVNRQAIDRQVDRQSTGDLTGNRQQYNNNNNINKGTNKQGNNDIECGKTAKRFVPPTLDEVAAYVNEIGANIDPQYFIDYYKTRGWKLKTGQIKDWKACVRTWVKKDKNDKAPVQQQRRILPAQDFQQRDYSGVDDDMMASLAKEMAAFKATGKVDM